MPENYITVPGEKGEVRISQEVIAQIVGTAISEVEGVDCLTNAAGPNFSEFIGLKSTSRGVSAVMTEDGAVRVDAAIYAKYGESIASIGEKAQTAAAAAVEAMTGLRSVVNIHIAGVTFDK